MENFFYYAAKILRDTVKFFKATERFDSLLFYTEFLVNNFIICVSFFFVFS